MLDQLTIRGRLVAAAMKLAAERPWREVTLPDIAAAANVSLVDVRNEFDTKGDVLAAFVRMVDDAVLARVPQRSGSQPARDALFEVIMSRFDVLATYKPALKSIAAAWPMDASLVRAIARSQAWMLRAAGIRSEGLEGQVRAAGLGTVYASAYRTWLSDNDPGLAKTMAALDRRLRRGESALQCFDAAVSKVCGLVDRCAAAARPRTGPAKAGADPNPSADPAATVPPGALS
jgi:ubiquinone biosynthesis protein COQ9